MRLIVDRSGNIGYGGQVQWGTSPTGTNPATQADFGGEFASDIIFFGPNDLTSEIEIPIHGNDVEDGNRTFVVTLNNPQTAGGSDIALLATTSVVCTIIDDDGAVVPTNVTYDGVDAYYDGNPMTFGET